MATPAPPSEGHTDIMETIATRAPSNLILPPRNSREIIEKTAGYIARNGAAFEAKVRESQGQQARMSFLLPTDEYHPYLRWRVEEIQAGRGTHVSAGRKEGEVTFSGREERTGPEKPEDFSFSARMPNISALDLEVVKTTALFAARNGRQWVTALSQREAGNYQFDFLRPQHSLYAFFQRLLEQYRDLLTGEQVEGGKPQKRRVEELEANVRDKWRILERARKRAEYVRWQEAQKVEQEEARQKEQIAYAQIDWHDFVVVETVVFDAADDHAQLPAPTSKNDLQSRSLEQKAAWGNDPSRRLEEAMPTADDYDLFYGGHQQSQQPVQQQHYPQEDTLAAQRERARAAQQAAAAQPQPQMPPPTTARPKAPSTANKKLPPNHSLCPNCAQAIPNDEFAQHLRIEMLSPEWRDQYKINQQRSLTTNLSSAEAAANLKRLASQRSDVFDPRAEGEAKRREVAQGVASEPPGLMQDGKGLSVEEQVRRIQERARNG